MTNGSLIDPAGIARSPNVDIGRGWRLAELPTSDIPALASAMARIEPWLDLGYRADALERYWRRPDAGACRIGVHGPEHCVGALCVRPRWLRGAFLELFCLLPAAQGQGIGGRIIDWLALVCAEFGPNLWTSASSTNQRALSFYRRQGFAEVSSLEGLIAAGEAELLLRRPLRAAPPNAPRPQ